MKSRTKPQGPDSQFRAASEWSNVNSPLTHAREQQCSSFPLFLSLRRTRINEPIHRTEQELDQKEIS